MSLETTVKWIDINESLPPTPNGAATPLFIQYKPKSKSNELVVIQAIWTGKKWKSLSPRFHRIDQDSVLRWTTMNNVIVDDNNEDRSAKTTNISLEKYENEDSKPIKERKNVVPLQRLLATNTFDDLVKIIDGLGLRWSFSGNELHQNRTRNKAKIFIQVKSNGNLTTERTYEGTSTQSCCIALANALVKFFIHEQDDYHKYNVRLIGKQLEEERHQHDVNCSLDFDDYDDSWANDTILNTLSD